MRVITIIDASSVEISDGGCPLPWTDSGSTGGLFSGPPGAFSAAKRPSGTLIRNRVSPIDYLGTAHRLASELRASLYTIPCYRALEQLSIVRSEASVREASMKLIGWGNSMFTGEPTKCREDVARILKIDVSS
jgi:hypothetical protein